MRKKKETNEKLSLQMDEFLDDLQLSGERINDLEEVVGVCSLSTFPTPQTSA
ncbi:hypothetical protein HpBGD42_15880 [Helicobacter pylori]